MKRTTWLFGGLVGVVVLAVVAFAQPGAGVGAGPEDGGAPAWGMGQRMMRGGGERLGGMMLGRLRALNLTAEQWTRVREIHQNTQKQVIPKQAEVRVAEIELRQLMQAATPNMSQIDAKIAEISTKRADVQKLHVRALIQVRGVLTPEQLQKFLDPTWRPALGKGAAGNEEGPMLRRRMMRQMQDDD